MADESFQRACLPIADLLSDSFHSEVVSFYFPEYGFALSDREYRGEQAEAESAITLYSGGIITRNEARSKVSFEALPDGNVFIDGVAVEGENNNSMDNKNSSSKKTLEEEKINDKF